LPIHKLRIQESAAIPVLQFPPAFGSTERPDGQHYPGFIYSFDAGACRNAVEPVKWYRKGAGQGEIQPLSGRRRPIPERPASHLDQ
jgi:hypothetical protein